ncbi:MAG: sigma-70 family RNA polymerase sigma factor [Oscillospiraceae bacterium]|nr:sigma-70 family RNA polymerase sigma factor [Oscillospiraceae bacterium]MBQ8011152.1 sigma-70 family RNA polymerase sigma factor [Oscillospiraceae bacterium]MBQ9110648.1 sigma-70 family RNA polymerase sigma factor [Oscillospiraceae bacterium]
MTDQELRTLVGESQEDGFRALFQQYQSYVYTIIWNQLRTVGTPEDAEECISDVFLQVFLHFGEIEDGSLQAYIGTVARHRAIDYFRKLTAAGKHSGACEETEELPSEENIAQDVEAAVEHRILYEKIQELGEPDRTILIMKYFYQRKSKDIARQVNLTPIAVRVRLNRALKKLRRLLNNEGISG